jgi:hypothetical protein
MEKKGKITNISNNNLNLISSTSLVNNNTIETCSYILENIIKINLKQSKLNIK